MALFQYRAVNGNGALIADSILAARESLKRQGVLVTKLWEKRINFAKFSLPLAQKLSFTRELAQLLKSGLPLFESLQSIEEKYRNHKLHLLFLHLCDAVKQGEGLSTALSDFPKSFDAIYIAMVAAGERSGSLPDVFSQLALRLGKEQKLKKQITTAMLYPAFLGVFCLILIVALFTFLIPSMRDLLQDRSLHPFTEFVLNLSSLFETYGIWMALVLFTCIGGAIVFVKKNRARMQHLVLHLPFIKGLATNAILARFSRSFSLLLTSGVPMLEAITLSKRVMDSAPFTELMEDAEHRLIEGKKFSTAFAASPLIPSLMARMVATAEESGGVDQMLTHLAEIYEEELERSLQQFLQLLTPVMILLLGLIVGLVLLSVLLPLTDVSSFL